MESTRVAVIGLGTMGRGILQRLVEAGLPAVGVARREETLEEVRKALASGTRMAVRRKRASAEEVEAGMKALTLTTLLADAAGVDLAIEAVGEEYTAKIEILQALAGSLPAEATLASNTSSLSLSRLGTESGCADRLLGLHFMNPVPDSRLVELVSTEVLKPSHRDRAQSLTEALGLTAVEVRDCPGFIVNRLLMPLIAEAARLLESGDADAQAIDSAMRLGCGHPMGPLALADMIGLDVILRELEQLDHELGPRYAPPEILLQTVADGHLGRKTGRGFHRYGGTK